MTVKKIYVELKDEELEFVKHLASMYGLTVEQELIALCKQKLHEERIVREDWR